MILIGTLVVIAGILLYARAGNRFAVHYNPPRVPPNLGTPLTQLTTGTSASATGGGGSTTTTPGTGTSPVSGGHLYVTGSYRIQIPAGFTNRHDRLPLPGGGIQSSWLDPMGGGGVVVEATPGTSSAQAIANSLRRQYSRQPGYSERFFGAVSLAGGQAWRWVFTAGPGGLGDVYYFLSACGHEFTVTGQSRSEQFASYLPTFDATARSLQPTC